MTLFHASLAAAALLGMADVRTERELEKLRAMDMRLAAAGYRLATANAALCRDRAPGTGLVVHAIDQYAPPLRASARAAFAFEAPVAIEGVVAGSPADLAGVRADDALVAVENDPLPAATAAAAVSSAASRDAALRRIAAVRPGRALTLGLVRHGAHRTAVVATVPACRASFEVVIDDKLLAQADAEVVQVSSTHFERHGDDGIAVTAAHELAHVILRHRARLEAAGVKRGLAAKFGRDRRLTRQAEDEADVLSVHLLRNAGYDPAIAARYWRDRAVTARPGLLGYRTHAAPLERARMIEAEIARIKPDAPRPFMPDVLVQTERTPK